MADVEIYIENIDEAPLNKWIASRIDELVEVQRDKDLIVYSGVYEKTMIPIIIQCNVEDRALTGVWFNSEHTPWASDIDCARDAFSCLGKTVQCDPGDEYPLENQFFEVSSSGEKVVEI